VGAAESRGHLQSLALLLLNAGKAVLCSLASLGVGHAEHVVGLDAAHHSGLAGNGRSEHQALGLLIHTVESVHGLLMGLVVAGGSLLVSGLGKSGVLNVGVLAAEESVDGGWGNGLLQKHVRNLKLTANYLPLRSGASCAPHPQSGRRFRAARPSG